MRGVSESDLVLPLGDFRAAARLVVPRRRSASADARYGVCEEALSGLERGAHIFCLTKGQFSMIDIIMTVIDKVGPVNLGLWTWCIADYEVQSVSKLINDGRVKSLRLVMDYAGLKRDMQLVSDLQSRFGVDCIRVSKTHAKIATLSTDCGWRLVARGSMNLNANPRFEQFDLSDCAETYAVVSAVMNEIWLRAPALPVGQVRHGDAVLALDSQAATPSAPEWFHPSLVPWF